jgi:hypothetical protein
MFLLQPCVRLVLLYAVTKAPKLGRDFVFLCDNSHNLCVFFHERDIAEPHLPRASLLVGGNLVGYRR